PKLAKQTLLPPTIASIVPAAALPGGEVELRGSNLGPRGATPPVVQVDGLAANLLMSRDNRISFRVPDAAADRTSAGRIEIRNPDGASNAVHLRVARLLSDGLHPVTSPV